MTPASPLHPHHLTIIVDRFRRRGNAGILLGPTSWRRTTQKQAIKVQVQLGVQACQIDEPLCGPQTVAAVRTLYGNDVLALRFQCGQLTLKQGSWHEVPPDLDSLL